MAALNLGAMDVVLAITEQNVQVAAGQIGQQPAPKGTQFQLTVKTRGRLVEPEEFADIILKGAPATGQAMSSGSMGGLSSGGSSGGGSSQSTQSSQDAGS